MRILMISDVYFPRINGVSTSIRTFHKELTELGHDITLIAPEYNENNGAHDWIHRVPSRYIPLDPEDRMMQRRHISTLYDTLKREQYDILHIQTPFVAHYEGVKLSRMLDIPRVETYHTHFEEYLYHYMPFAPKSLMRFSARWFNRQQCNDVDAVIVPSQAMLNILEDYGIERPKEIIATGIDEEFFKKGDGSRFRAKYGIEQNRPVLVHVGRVAHEKNIDFLLQMLPLVRKTIPDILLVIAGEGPATGHLQNLVRTLDLENNVQFVGYLDRATTLLDCYCAGDIFVFASRTETQGLVLLEAMAQGVPVVSISALGTDDILGPGQGALVAQEDREDFATKVIRLLQDPAQRSHLAREARVYAGTWSAKSFAVKTELFYQKAIEGYRLN